MVIYFSSLAKKSKKQAKEGDRKYIDLRFSAQTAASQAGHVNSNDNEQQLNFNSKNCDLVSLSFLRLQPRTPQHLSSAGATYCSNFKPISISHIADT